MSFRIIAMDGKNRRIHAMADKRCGIHTYQDDVKTQWDFISDDVIKIRMIAPDIFFMGGKYLEFFDNCFRSLLSMRDQPASRIIETAKQFDRNIIPPSLKPLGPYEEVSVFGLYDDGKLFVWNGLPDGTDELIFAEKPWFVKMGGGSEGTQEAAKTYFLESLNKWRRFPQAMSETLLYTASIDEVISPTYDYIQISEKK